MADPVPVTEPLFIYNHDLVGLINRFNRFIEEMFKSVSSGVSQFNQFDAARLQAYLTNAQGYVAWIINQPQLDLPESNPKAYTLETPPVITQVENEEVNDILRMFVVMRIETSNSQSARNAAGLIPFDQNRIIAVLNKVQAFLDSYIKPLTPLDLPESSPALPVTGPGHGGV